MKYSLILFILSHLAFAHDFDITLRTDNNQLNRIIKPLWNKIDYDYDIKNLDLYNSSKEETLSYQLINSHISLAPYAVPLFKLNIISQDSGELIWSLDELLTNSLMKIRFKYKKFGIQLTHDEYFRVKANKISGARSKFTLEKHNGKYKINIYENANFDLEEVLVEPKDGIGSVLRYIFDNIFSANVVNQYITDSINKELNIWLNNQALFHSIETEINTAIENFETSPIILNDIASSFNINIKKASLLPKELKLQTKISFNHHYPIHHCADELPINKDINITASHSLIEQLVINYGINERVKEGEVLEPLFCFGYKEYNQNGDPIGESLSSRFLGKNITFKYWVKPQQKPKFSYNMNENTITLQLKLKAIIKSTTYPKVFAYKDRILIKQNITFKLKNTTKGLVLEYQNSNLSSITGKLKVKWSRLTPKITLPLSIVKSSLSKAIDSSLSQTASVQVLPNTITLTEELNLNLNQYIMINSGHQIELGISDD